MTGDAGAQPNEDPGWHFTLRAFLPGQLQLRHLRRVGGDPLITLRNVYLSFPLAMVIFGVVLPFILPFRTGRAGFGWVVAVAALALVYAVTRSVVERPLRCESDQVLSATFRARMFQRIAFADSTAILGFVGAFSANSSWVYYAGLLISLANFVHAAPTKAALTRDQDELVAQGCGRSLVAALRGTPPK